VALVVGVFVTWRRGVAIIKHVFSNVSTGACLAQAFAGAAWAIIGARDEPAVYVVAAGAVVVAIGLEAIDRRQNRIAKEVSISA
jgi:hypothetical protein